MSHVHYPKLTPLTSEDPVDCALWHRKVHALCKSHYRQRDFSLQIFVADVIAHLPSSFQLWGDRFLKDFDSKWQQWERESVDIDVRWEYFGEKFSHRFGLSGAKIHMLWTQLTQDATQTGMQFLDKAAFLIAEASFINDSMIDAVIGKMLPSYSRLLIAQQLSTWQDLEATVQRIDSLEAAKTPSANTLFQSDGIAPSLTAAHVNSIKPSIPLSPAQSLLHLKVPQDVQRFLSAPGHLLPYLWEVAQIDCPSDWGALESVGLSKAKFAEILNAAVEGLNPHIRYSVQQMQTPPIVKQEPQEPVRTTQSVQNVQVSSNQESDIVNQLHTLEQSVSSLAERVSKMDTHLNEDCNASDSESVLIGAAISKLKLVSDDFCFGSRRVRSLLDTGASINLVRNSVLPKIGIRTPPSPTKTVLLTAGNQKITPLGKVNIPLAISDHPLGKVEFFVAESLPFPAILGSQFFDAFNGIIDFKERQLALSSKGSTVTVPFCPVQRSSSSRSSSNIVTRARLNVKLLHDSAKLPKRASPQAAGFDIYTPQAFSLAPNERKAISSGIAVRVPGSCYGRLCSRPFSAARGIDVVGGVISRDCNDEVKVILHNFSDSSVSFNQHDSIALLIVEQMRLCNVASVSGLPKTQRRSTLPDSSGN